MDSFDLEFWISGGRIVDRPTKPNGEPVSERQLLHASDFVKLQTGTSGTRIEWVMFSANWSSLIFVIDFMMSCTAPITLRYFNVGWFEETLGTAESARDRIEAIMAKSDIRFAQRAYTEEYDPVSHDMPEKLRASFESMAAPDDWAVICSVDTDREVVTVEHVGSDSALGQIWGVSPVSYPCQTGHSYDRIVSRTYYDALKSGKPVYDHVLAAMIRPEGDVIWVGYKRLVFPETKLVNGFGRVKVVSQLGPVDIKLV
jgi:hypothetical protein